MIKPTEPQKRIESVDIVRGFALFGVLLVNMYNFGATFPVWTSPHDEIALSITQIFFEYKSFRLFSFLFGFGIALQLAKTNNTNTFNTLFYLRRLTVLFLFGIINCLLYDGDVLMLYAEFGIILLLIHKVPNSILLIGWLVLNLHFPIQNAFNSISKSQTEVITTQEKIDLSKAQIQQIKESHPYSVGSIWDVMMFNSKAIPPNPLENTSFLGMCLLGMYAARKRYFQESIKHRPFIKRLLIWGGLLGLLAMIVIQLLKFKVGYSSEGVSGATLIQQIVGDLCSIIGSTLLSLSYAAGLILISQTKRFKQLIIPLAAVGRFALSTYLLQTIMFTTLFYGYGFNQGLISGPFATMIYAIIFFIIQIIICNWWAKYFRFGPIEWIWRSMSYWKRIPIKKIN